MVERESIEMVQLLELQECWCSDDISKVKVETDFGDRQWAHLDLGAGEGNGRTFGRDEVQPPVLPDGCSRVRLRPVSSLP